MGSRREHGGRDPAAEGARNPHDKDHHELIGELCTRSAEFARLWSSHDVLRLGAGFKHFHHPAVGDLTLAFESLDLVSAPGLTLTTYTPEPRSESAERMRLLASWAATREAEQDPAARTEQPHAAPGEPRYAPARSSHEPSPSCLSSSSRSSPSSEMRRRISDAAHGGMRR